MSVPPSGYSATATPPCLTAHPGGAGFLYVGVLLATPAWSVGTAQPLLLAYSTRTGREHLENVASSLLGPRNLAFPGKCSEGNQR